jgi:hypothetical protein
MGMGEGKLACEGKEGPREGACTCDKEGDSCRICDESARVPSTTSALAYSCSHAPMGADAEASE